MKLGAAVRVVKQQEILAGIAKVSADDFLFQLADPTWKVFRVTINGKVGMAALSIKEIKGKESSVIGFLKIGLQHTKTEIEQFIKANPVDSSLIKLGES